MTSSSSDPLDNLGAGDGAAATDRRPSMPVAAGQPASIYDRYFWLMYAANFVLVAANATTFRFAELVAFFEQTELVAGQLIAIGLVGAVVIRYLFAHELDRYGYRRVWSFGAILVLLGAVLMATARDVGPSLYAARVGFSTGLAIVFACSNAHIQTRVPEHRRTEMIAMIGSSGFLGLMFGILLGDQILARTADSIFRYRLLFGCSTALAAVHFAIALYVTRVEDKPVRRNVDHSLKLLWRYWPGACTLPGLMMGAGFTCTSVYLTRFTTKQGFDELAPFFFGYAITAFSTRMVGRTWPARFGRQALIVAGCASQAIGFAVFPLVSTKLMLVIPAIGIGFGHAVLFPSIVSIGSGRFPMEYRATGTLLTMGIFDVGALTSAPIEGWIAERFDFGTLFLTVSAGFVVAGVVYRILSFGEYDLERDPRLAGQSPWSRPKPRLQAACSSHSDR